MPLFVNLRHLEQRNLHLNGVLALDELDIDPLDELIQLKEPLIYDLEVEKLDKGLLVQGVLRLLLECQCARCLSSYSHCVELPDWSTHISLEGEEKAEIVNDCVDLTPFIRDDIVLAFPQHPLCKPECKGLLPPEKETGHGGERKLNLTSSAWAELNKLKF